MLNRDGERPIGPEALSAARRVHAVCERFEAETRGGGRPRIEDQVGGFEGPTRALLVEELLTLEIELRLARGERPTVSEYLDRFPDFGPVVDGLLGPSPPPGAPSDRTETWPMAGPTSWSSTLTGGPSGPSALQPPPLPKGERFGKYELVEELARGGMGVVYRARDLVLNREVAIKMILSGTLATEDERARFLREATLAANLDHPNIVPIHGVGEQDGFLYFTMRLVEGGSLAGRTGSFQQDPHAAGRLVAVLARAIEHAHRKGFIHCDLKPSNVLMDRDGVPQITDFGLARRASRDSSLTASGAVMGTPSYMAPEQASGRRDEVGPATDVHGLGAIFYELLTGRPPFQAPTSMETVLQALYSEPTPPREVRPDVPTELETVCLKCLEKAPEDRYPSAEALADDLVRCLQGEPVEAAGALRRLKRWSRREPEVVSRLAGLAAASVMTEYNYRFALPDAAPLTHGQVQAVLALWAGLTLLFQRLHREGRRSDQVRRLWSLGDVFCLTVLLRLLGVLDTPLLIGYPLLIAASGLWFRERLVWFTTAFATLGYLCLYLMAGLRWADGEASWTWPEAQPYGKVFVACLALLGFVVARLVRRFLVVSRYYEARQNA